MRASDRAVISHSIRLQAAQLGAERSEPTEILSVESHTNPREAMRDMYEPHDYRASRDIRDAKRDMRARGERIRAAHQFHTAA